MKEEERIFYIQIMELVVRENTWYKKQNRIKAQNLEWGENCSLEERIQEIRKDESQQ